MLNIKLTKEGEEAIEESEETEVSFDKILECLNDEEQQNLSSYLDRIITTLESQVDEELEAEIPHHHHRRGANSLQRNENCYNQRAAMQRNFDSPVRGKRGFGGGIVPEEK